MSTPSSNRRALSGTFLRVRRKPLCRDRKRIPGLVKRKKEPKFKVSHTRAAARVGICGRRTRDDEVEVFILDMADRNAKSVDALQDEVFRPGPSQVADGVQELHHADRRVSRHLHQVYQQAQHRRTVIYVPPMRGSAIWVWNAEIPTNCTVLEVQHADFVSNLM